MYLVIDNSLPETVGFYRSSPVGWDFESWPRLSNLDLTLADFLKSKSLNLSDIEALGVCNLNVGRFTATRVAATVVNVLAYALGVRVVYLPDDQNGWKEIFDSAIVGQYISADYSAAPRLYGH